MLTLSSTINFESSLSEDITKNNDNTQNKHSRDSRQLVGYRVQIDWKWSRDAKSECISVSDDGKAAYFFDSPYTISRGTVGKEGLSHHTYKTSLSGLKFFLI